MTTFIVDCPRCKAKVAAEESGIAEQQFFDTEIGEPEGTRLHVGKCPRCSTIIAGYSVQIGFENYDSEEDVWGDVVRIYPQPGKTFTSRRIPSSVNQSLEEADKSMQAGANIAACAMFGRALEAVCRDILIDKSDTNPKRVMLGEGIKELKAKNIIDERLFNWSQQLQAFRNIAAHAEGTPISREDAEDLQVFVHAIIEYIYDLADRYAEFQERQAERKRPRRTVAEMFGGVAEQLGKAGDPKAAP